MLTWYDARDEACFPLRLPRTGYKARQGSGLCTSMGREQTAGQQDGARNGSAFPSQTSRGGAQGTGSGWPRYFYGQEQTAGQHGRSAGDLAAGWLYTDWIQTGYGLDTDWIQEPDEVQHTRLWRGC